MKSHKLLPFLLCVFLIAGLFSGCGMTLANGGPGDTSPSPSGSPSTEDFSGRKLTHAASYADVYKALNDAAARASAVMQYGAARDSATIGKADTGVSATPANNGASNETAGAPIGDYSQTNVQVDDVDEGDIVKTDGQYIYVLRQNELIIFKADGASTTRISSVKVGSDNTGKTPELGNGKTPESTIYSNEYASDIYVTGDTAVIVSSYSSYGPYRGESTFKSDSTSGNKSIIGADDTAKIAIAPDNNQQISKIYILDITDRSKPVIKTELGQDGYVLSTRLVDTTLYMLSTYYVYSATESDNGTYIPRLYTNGVSKLASPDSISIMPYFNSTGYTVICAYDLADASLSANQSILGGGSTVYMNKDTLYIANSTSDQQAGNPYTDSIYSVIDYTMSNVTDITSFDIRDGALSLKASGTVQGSLNSQFALDEFGGNLRVVTTSNNQSWSEYTDKAKGFVNYVYKDPSSANALYVLDGSMKPIGSVENLAKDEQVYSVRFDGEIGYFVTFRQVDPLFAVDLSDPTKPTVLSALKIPGFSEYLHVYSPGRLFGLGMDADTETGRTNGMKLTMFDTTDPTNVTVKNTLKLDTGYSNALYNHKAILISADKSIIAFPADNGYDIYGYSDTQGFFKRASVSSVEWTGDSRGLYIGDKAYIVDTNSISVLDMTSLVLLNRISY